MPGKNWNSKQGTWTPIVRPETKELAARAARLRATGKTVAQIAKELGRSQSRVRELLKD
mgnify:CR=1 FL=1